MGKTALAIAALGTSLIGGTALSADATDSPAQICRVAHSPGKHVGKTIVFRGEYITDHIERSAVQPLGCDRGFGLGEVSPAAEKIIDDADNPPWHPGSRRIIATFKATLVQVQRNNFEFAHDDGVRLNVASITDLEVSDGGATH